MKTLCALLVTAAAAFAGPIVPVSGTATYFTCYFAVDCVTSVEYHFTGSFDGLLVKVDYWRDSGAQVPDGSGFANNSATSGGTARIGGVQSAYFQFLVDPAAGYLTLYDFNNALLATVQIWGSVVFYGSNSRQFGREVDVESKYGIVSTPEPASAMLVLSGLGAGWLASRRRTERR